MCVNKPWKDNYFLDSVFCTAVSYIDQSSENNLTFQGLFTQAVSINNVKGFVTHSKSILLGRVQE